MRRSAEQSREISHNVGEEKLAARAKEKSKRQELELKLVTQKERANRSEAEVKKLKELRVNRKIVDFMFGLFLVPMLFNVSDFLF